MYFCIMLHPQSHISFQFPKKQRITHKKRIAQLFAEGVPAKAFPFRVQFLLNDLAYHRILIAVPKRNVPLATNRNHIKRLMREAFRLNQQHLKTTSHIDLLFIFTGKEKPTYSEIERKLIKLFDKIQIQATPSK